MRRRNELFDAMYVPAIRHVRDVLCASFCGASYGRVMGGVLASYGRGAGRYGGMKMFLPTSSPDALPSGFRFLGRLWGLWGEE